MNDPDPFAIVGEVESALEEGRIPRARRPLKEAARRLAELSRIPEALRACELLACLELRSARPGSALNAARAGLRIARSGSPADQARMLQLIARVHLAAGDRRRSLDSARRSVRAAVNGEVEPHLCLAEAAREAGDLDVAICSAEEALERAREGEESLLPQAECVAAEVLLEGGLPTSAVELLGSSLKREADRRFRIRVLLRRGNGRLMLGRQDQAARDFRAAARLGKEMTDRRLEGLSLGALATVEILRAREEENRARLGRAEAALERAARIARRFKDPYLSATIEDLRKIAAAGTGGDTREAHGVARELIRLGKSVESPLLVDACITEVKRLAVLPPDAPAYGMEPLPLRLSPV